MKDCVSQGKKSRMNNNADDLHALLKWKSNDHDKLTQVPLVRPNSRRFLSRES